MKTVPLKVVFKSTISEDQQQFFWFSIYYFLKSPRKKVHLDKSLSQGIIFSGKKKNPPNSMQFLSYSKTKFGDFGGKIRTISGEKKFFWFSIYYFLKSPRKKVHLDKSLSQGIIFSGGKKIHQIHCSFGVIQKRNLAILAGVFELRRRAIYQNNLLDKAFHMGPFPEHFDPILPNKGHSEVILRSFEVIWSNFWTT